MCRPRNHNAVYVPSNKILDLLKREETVIVTKVGNAVPRAFPDSQVLRPHVARVGTDKDNIPVTMTYCGLTNLVSLANMNSCQTHGRTQALPEPQRGILCFSMTIAGNGVQHSFAQ